MRANGNIGDYDEHDPDGTGYQIMTERGLVTFDKGEKEEYLAEKRRVSEWLKKQHEEFAQG